MKMQQETPMASLDGSRVLRSADRQRNYLARGNQYEVQESTFGEGKRCCHGAEVVRLFIFLFRGSKRRLGRRVVEQKVKERTAPCEAPCTESFLLYLSPAKLAIKTEIACTGGNRGVKGKEVRCRKTAATGQEKRSAPKISPSSLQENLEPGERIGPFGTTRVAQGGEKRKNIPKNARSPWRNGSKE